jgi:thioredoxin-like negative regulator of GroEL
VALLALAAATQVAAASDRFVPADPGFVVANVRQSMPDEELRALLDNWRAHSATEAPTVALAEAFIDRARTRREPRYFGRAEAVLAPQAIRAGSGATLRRLYAEVLQYRHAFAAAESLLDAILRESPRDTSARTLRASIRLVRGDFSGARGDCALLAAAGGPEAQVGFSCLAEALAGGGQLERAQALLAQAPSAQTMAKEQAPRAYLLATRGELRERSYDLDGAIADYSAALAASPQDDSIRAALADVLASRGDVARALELLAVPRPSVALLVRRVGLLQGAARAEADARARGWLELEAARGDALHYREASILALSSGDTATAVAAARKNFEVQKELPDIRALARAAVAASNGAEIAALQAWLRQSGYRDAFTEKLLGEAPAVRVRP